MKKDKDLKFLIKVIRILHSKISNLESELEEAEQKNDSYWRMIKLQGTILDKKLIKVRKK
jgi:hypothetical protein